MPRWSTEDLATAMAANEDLARRNSGAQSPFKPPKPIHRSGVGKQLDGALDAQIKGSGKAHKPRKDYKAELVQQCELIGLKMEPEFKFLLGRGFRADWRVHYGIWEGKRPKKITHFIKSTVLVEYEGGIYSSGKRGHSSVSGIQRDIEKNNLAQIDGWTVIRVTPKHVVSGEAVMWIMDALKREVICGACHLRQPVPPSDHEF
jgi:hypothetical protein